MKHFKKLAMCALLLPAGAFAAGQPGAQDPAQESAAQPSGQQQQPGQRAGQQPGQQPGQPTGQQPGQHDRDRTTVAADQDRDMQRTGQHAQFMERAPANAMRADQLIGKELHTRVGDDEIGTIDDLLIDENGQIVAVVVSVGGFLGIGERDVAISWDAVERTRDGDDDYRLTVNATEDSLRNAPEFDEDAQQAGATTRRGRNR